MTLKTGNKMFMFILRSLLRRIARSLVNVDLDKSYRQFYKMMSHFCCLALFWERDNLL